jgi:hypothetical protein
VAKQERWEQAKADIEGLGLFVRSLVGLDREAATRAIAAFVSGKTLGAKQFEFMSLIVEYLTEHGVMKPELFYATLFTNLNPQGPEGVSDSAQVYELVSVLDEVRAHGRGVSLTLSSGLGPRSPGGAHRARTRTVSIDRSKQGCRQVRSNWHVLSAGTGRGSARGTPRFADKLLFGNHELESTFLQAPRPPPRLGDINPRSAANILRLAGPLRPLPLLDALRRMTKALPERADFRLSLAYLQALLKVDQSDVEATLARGEGAFTDKGLYRIVGMLAALEAGRTYDAAQLLDGSDIDWSEAPAAWKAVRVATLARSGQNFAARQAAEGLDPSRLSLPEKALVADLLPKRR